MRKKKDTVFSAEEIAEAMEQVYTFVMVSHDVFAHVHDYGGRDKMNMAEIHTLSLIADNPGISVSGVSEMWHRTLSAASQNVNKLCKKGLVEKRKENGDRKTLHLYATEQGEALSQLHKAFDRERISNVLKSLSENFTKKQLYTFLEVVRVGTGLLESDPY